MPFSRRGVEWYPRCARSSTSSRRMSDSSRANSHVYEQIDSPGGDYADLREFTFEQFVAECEKDEQCAAFTYVRRHLQCRLKWSWSNSVTVKSAISGKKD